MLTTGCDSDEGRREAFESFDQTFSESLPPEARVYLRRFLFAKLFLLRLLPPKEKAVSGLSER